MLILFLLVRVTYIIGVVHNVHPVHGKSHIQHTTEMLQHLQQGWARLVELTARERHKQNAN